MAGALLAGGVLAGSLRSCAAAGVASKLADASHVISHASPATIVRARPVMSPERVRQVVEELLSNRGYKP